MKGSRILIGSFAGCPDLATFRQLGDYLLWAFFKITSVAHISGLLFSTHYYALIFTKMGWATFWTNFPQTHLVTLVLC
jgi:hypothetical protein